MATALTTPSQVQVGWKVRIPEDFHNQYYATHEWCPEFFEVSSICQDNTCEDEFWCIWLSPAPGDGLFFAKDMADTECLEVLK